jgi:hypothetical protein
MIIARSHAQCARARLGRLPSGTLACALWTNERVSLLWSAMAT